MTVPDYRANSAITRIRQVGNLAVGYYHSHLPQTALGMNLWGLRYLGLTPASVFGDAKVLERIPRMATGQGALPDRYNEWHSDLSKLTDQEAQEQLFSLTRDSWLEKGLDLERPLRFLQRYSRVVAPSMDDYLIKLAEHVYARDFDRVWKRSVFTQRIHENVIEPLERISVGLRNVSVRFRDEIADATDVEYAQERLRALGRLLLSMPGTLEDIALSHRLPGYIQLGGEEDLDTYTQQLIGRAST